MTPNGTTSTASHRAPAPRRRDLFSRTALCSALMSLSVLSAPAYALPVLTGTPQVAGGGAPGISSGAGSTNVTLNANRTVIDWASFNVGGGEAVHYTFNDRSAIVLNRIGGSTTPTVAGVIDGRVNGAYGGNIWFASRNGMLFSSGSSVDAGGILISAAAPDLGGFLSPGNLTFGFSGGDVINAPVIKMESGSAITGHGGLVALISPSVVTEGGTQVNGVGGSSVLFGSTTGYTLRLQQNAPGDFDLVDFFIPDSSIGSQATAALDLQNTTTGNSVFFAAVSRSSASSAVINIQGLVTAQAASADGGDIILSGGGGISARTVGSPVGGTTTDMYLHTMSASRDIVLQNAGQVLAKNFVRPPPPPPVAPPVISPPPPPPPPPANGNGNGFRIGGNGGCGNGCIIVDGSIFESITDAFTPTISLHSVSDGSRLSNFAAGRDIKLTASRTITLGTARAVRDLTTDSPDLLANVLAGGRTVTLTSSTGDLSIGSLAVGAGGAVRAANAVQIDSFSLTGGALSIRAATDLNVGDGSGSASGGTVTLTAGHDVNLNLSSANIDTVSAGATANLQAGTLNVNTVTGSQILARGGSVTIGTATSVGDVYVLAQGGSATVGTATAGDDVYILASGVGAASLNKAVLTGAAADTSGPVFAGNPDTAGNGRVVAVQSGGGDALLGQGTGTVSGATAVIVKAGQDATVDLPTALPGALTVSAARDAILRAPTVNFDAVTAGRDISLIATVGNFSSNRSLVATRNITIGAAGALQLADISAADGSITLSGTSVSAGAVSAGQDLTLKASGGAVTLASFKAGRDLLIQGSTLSLGQQLAPIGRDLSITSPGAFTSASDLTAGRNLTLAVGGNASLKGLSSPGTISVAAANVTISGPVAATGVTGGNVVIGATGALQLSDINAASGSITLTGTSVSAGAASAGQDLTLNASGGAVALTSFKAGRDLVIQGSTLSLGQQLAPISRDISITSPGAFTTASDLTAGRNLTLAVGGNASLKGLSSPGTIGVTAANVTISGPVAATGAVGVTGGNVVITGPVSGANVTLSGATGVAGANLTLSGPVTATGAVALAGTNVAINGAVTASGAVGVTGTTVTAGGPVTAGGAVSITGTTITASGPLNGAAVSVTGTGATTLGAVTATGNIGVTGTNVAINGAVTTTAGTVGIIANDLALGGVVTAANVQIESATGALRVGGSAADGAPPSGLWLDNAEFGRLHATGLVNLYAGPVAGAARGDLMLLALDVTPASTPKVNFLVGGGRNALVNGVVAPTVSGAVLHIGDNSNTAWQPNSILVSGTLGSATFSGGAYSNVRSFTDVRLFATQDIIIGSQRFIDLIQSTAKADIEIGRNKPSGVAPVGVEQNRVLVASGMLELSTNGKAVTQNTAPSAAQSVGLFLNAGNGQPNLLIDPPQLVDVYGAYISQSGTVVSSFSAGAGLAFAIVDAAGNPASAPAGAIYRFNSCTVGTSQCSGAASVTGSLQQNTPVLSSPVGPAIGSDLGPGAPASGGGESGGGDGADGGGSSGSSGGGKGGARTTSSRNSQPPLLTPGPVEADVALIEPVVTGAGSEEIWRKNKRAAVKPQPAGAKP